MVNLNTSSKKNGELVDTGNPHHKKPASYSPEWAHELGTGVTMHTDSVVRKMVQCLNGHDLPSNTLGGVEVGRNH